ncbi:MAG: DUF3127 domain-containing protein [Rikenellaceae bacterium]
MELEGKIVAVLELQKGNTAKGEWKKQNFVIETISDFPKKVCVTVWGDKVAALSSMTIGEMVSLSVDLESREFNGKWYTDVKAFRIEKTAQVMSGGSRNSAKVDQGMPPMPSQDDFNSIYSSEEDFVF